MSTLTDQNFDRIWLEPREGADPYIGRQWCQDNQWGEDGIEYVRADRIEQLERENAELRSELASARETNRKLHRRAQLAEAANQCAPDYLRAWLEVLTQSPGRNRERRLVLWIIRDIQDRFGKLSGRARRLAEQEGTDAS